MGRESREVEGDSPGPGSFEDLTLFRPARRGAVTPCRQGVGADGQSGRVPRTDRRGVVVYVSLRRRRVGPTTQGDLTQDRRTPGNLGVVWVLGWVGSGLLPRHSSKTVTSQPRIPSPHDSTMDTSLELILSSGVSLPTLRVQVSDHTVDLTEEGVSTGSFPHQIGGRVVDGVPSGVGLCSLFVCLFVSVPCHGH